MATPSGINIGNLNGKWVIDRHHSTDPDAGLKIGINWMLRKAVGLAAVTLHISFHEGESSHQAPYLEILQVPTGGLAQISEIRTLDGKKSTVLSDFLFGSRTSRNQLLRATEGPNNRVVPSVDPETPICDPKIGQFLRGDIEEDGAEGGGFLFETTAEEPLWIHSFDKREDDAWSVEQVWGFELIDGERYHTRRFAVANKSGIFTTGRVVFSYLA